MESISHLITTGLLNDLIVAERSYLLNKAINKMHSGIESNIKTDISKILFDLSYTEMVLSLASLYDNTSKKYQTRCIKRLYQLVEEENYEVFVNKSNVALQLGYFGFDTTYISLLERSTDREFNERAITFFELNEMNEPVCSSIIKIKEIRDKLLAHNEDISLDTLVPYEKIETLVTHAKKVISFFALAYSDIHLQINGDFYLSDRAMNWKRLYEKFIKNGA